MHDIWLTAADPGVNPEPLSLQEKLGNVVILQKDRSTDELLAMLRERVLEKA